MLITHLLPNSVLACARATTRPFGRTRSGTERRTIATVWPRRRDEVSERQRGFGFGFGLGSETGGGAGGGVATATVSEARFAAAADRAE
jgi:hypothetical protein